MGNETKILEAMEQSPKSDLTLQLKTMPIQDLTTGIRLVPFDGSEVENYDSWFDRSKNPDVMRYLHKSTPYTTDSEKTVPASEFVDFMVKSPKYVYYRIEHPQHGFVGHVSLNSIDYENMDCWLGFVIGRQETWGQGITSNAVRVLVDYLRERGFKKVKASAHVENERSKAILKKFLEEKETKDDSVIFEKVL